MAPWPSTALMVRTDQNRTKKSSLSPCRTLQPKDFNPGDSGLSNELAKARKDHFSATMRMLLRKRDFKIYGVELFLDFTPDFEGIIIVFDTWLLCFLGA